MANPLKSSSLENLFVNESQRTIFAEISYLKKRIHLLEGERKAHYQLNEETLKRNETIIQQLREKNQNLKIEREKLTKIQQDNYFQLITNFFSGNKKAAYEFKGKSFEVTKDILECKIGDVKNKLNLLTFKKNQIQKQRKEFVEKEEKLVELINSNNSQNRKKKEQQRSFGTNNIVDEIETIENKISEMKIKVTEGENLQTRYKNMITTLTNSNLAKTSKIMQIENDVMQETKQIDRLTQTLSEALKVKKEAKTRLIEMEEQTLAEYGNREQNLFEARLKLKDIREKTEAIGTKLTYPKFHMIHRDSSLSGGLLIGFDGSMLLTTDEMKSLSSNNVNEKVYKQLQQMTGESDPIQIVKRFQEQREHSKALVIQMEEAISYVRKCKLRKRFLEDKLRNLQFSGGQERQILDDQYEKVKNQFDEMAGKKVVMVQTINNNKFLMEEIFEKLSNLCLVVDIQFDELDNEDIQNMNTSERIIKILQLIYNQVQEALQARREIEVETATPLVSPVESNISHADSTVNGLITENYFFGTNNKLLADELRRSTADLTKLSDFDRSISASPFPISPADDAQLSNMGRNSSGFLIANRSPTVRSRKSESSEDEEAIGRNFIKRQSQVLVEAKTRKGSRFNSAVTMNARPKKF